MENVKLGKLPYRHDPRTLLLEDYIKVGEAAPPPPTWAALPAAIHDWPMYGNDRLGDCTCAAAGHMIECWTAEEQYKPEEVPESAVINMYEAITGGQDTGAVELDVLRYWRKNGLSGHKPYAFALIGVHNRLHMKLAATLFAGVYIGIRLPVTAQAQTGPGPGKIWHTVPRSGANGSAGSWGGHAVNVVAYDAIGPTVVTWGFLQKMTWGFWNKYVDECWAILPAEWATTAPDIPGFDFAAFAADLGKIGQLAG